MKSFLPLRGFVGNLVSGVLGLLKWFLDRMSRVKEKRKAYLVAAGYVKGRGSTAIHYVKVQNRGSAEARDVRIFLDGRPFPNQGRGAAGNDLPTIIGPHTRITLPIFLSWDEPEPKAVAITWSDDSREAGSYRSRLTF